MFELGIERASHFTRAVHTISRTFNSNVVHVGAATLTFLNSEGWAITCKHVAQLVLSAEQINSQYLQYREELKALVGKGKKEKAVRRDLQTKYKIYNGTMIQIRNRFMNCIQGNLNANVILHKSLDLALLRFQDCQLLVEKFPILPRETGGLKSGKSLCRLGFPFPEYTNFKYNPSTDDIEWTEEGNKGSPWFPIEGMVTRMVADGNPRQVNGFELSTPGLKGQSGGPAFDEEGRLWGLQSQTIHLHLGFDVKQIVYIDGQAVEAEDHAFLHVGRCVHIDRIKEFLRANNVRFDEG